MLDGTEYFECACHSDEHTLRFTLSLDDDPEIYTSVFLGSYPWGLRRLWTGIKYIFGYKCKFGHWDCFIMKPEDAFRLQGMLVKLIEKGLPKQHSAESGAPRREAGDRAGPLVSRQPNDSNCNSEEK